MSDSPIEKMHIDEFLTLVEGLEVYKSDRQSPPEPDFCAQTNFGLIGIEHTRLFKMVDQNGVNPVEEDQLAEDIMNKAEEIFMKESGLKVHVSVSFSSTVSYYHKMSNPPSLKKQSKTGLARQIARFVIDNMPEKGKYEYFKNPNQYSGENVLPSLISGINIGNSDELKSPSFFSVSSHFVPPLENSRLFEAIDKKNSKPKNYQHDYSQTWLVMVASPFNITMDFNFERDKFPQIKSTFDRVFIYRHGDMMYHELPKMAK